MNDYFKLSPVDGDRSSGMYICQAAYRWATGGMFLYVIIITFYVFVIVPSIETASVAEQRGGCS